MSARLPDPEIKAVRALAQGDLDAMANEPPEEHGDHCGPCRMARGLVALADEVQQARARRCGDCHHCDASKAYVMGADPHTKRFACSLHTIGGSLFMVTPDWFCAGFTPKDGAK